MSTGNSFLIIQLKFLVLPLVRIFLSKKWIATGMKKWRKLKAPFGLRKCMGCQWSVVSNCQNSFSITTYLYCPTQLLLSQTTRRIYVVRKMNNMFVKFIWNRGEAVKRNTAIADFDMGGIKMFHVNSFFNSLKMSWIKKLANEEVAVLKKKYCLVSC